MKSAFGIIHKSDDSKKAAEYAGYGVGLAGAAGVVGAKEIRDAVVKPRLKKIKRQRRKWEKDAPKTYARAQSYRAGATWAGSAKKEAQAKVKADPVGEGAKPTKSQKKAIKQVAYWTGKEEKYKGKTAAISRRSLAQQKYLTLKPQQIKRLTATKVGLAAGGVGLAGLTAGEVARRSRRQPKPQPIEKRGSWWSGT